MQVRTRHTPTFGVARLVLAPSEGVLTSAGAMVATSYGVGVERAAGTAFKQVARSWKDAEICTAPPEGGWVDVSPTLPGDLHLLELDGTGWCLGRDSWLAAASTVRLEIGWYGFRTIFGGDVGFLAHADGSGPLVLACCGALDLVTLAPGELITVDPGHVVAYPDSVQCRLRAVHPSVQTQSVRTGEGLVLDFAGPGQLVTQTRGARAMATWLAGLAPADR